MTKTHTTKFTTENLQVTAWQFDKAKPIPVWVARTFHDIGETGWSSIAADGHVVDALPGDWAVCINEKIGIVLTDKEFQKHFAAL